VTRAPPESPLGDAKSHAHPVTEGEAIGGAFPGYGTREGVESMAQRLSKEGVVTIRVLAEKGQNHCEIARTLGVTEGAVRCGRPEYPAPPTRHLRRGHRHANTPGGLGQASRTSWRYDAIMTPMATPTKRATVYFDESLHRALRIKAAETDQSISELVNEAVREALAEDAEDLAAFDDRAGEPSLPFEDFVRDLRRRGKI